MTSTMRDTTVRETYAQCIVLSNKFYFVSSCPNIDELFSKQNIPMCSSGRSQVSVVFLWTFACCSNMMIF